MSHRPSLSSKEPAAPTSRLAPTLQALELGQSCPVMDRRVDRQMGARGACTSGLQVGSHELGPESEGEREGGEGAC